MNSVNKVRTFKEIAEMSDEELDELFPIDKQTTHYSLTYYLKVGNFDGIRDWYGVTLEDLKKRLTEAITEVLWSYPDGKPTLLPPDVREDTSETNHPKIEVYINYD